MDKIFVILLVIGIGTVCGIRNLENQTKDDNQSETHGRQSKAISFFPTEVQSNLVESTANDRQFDRDGNQLRFSNEQRNQPLNRNEQVYYNQPSQYYRQQQNYGFQQQQYQPQYQYTPEYTQPPGYYQNPNPFYANQFNYNRPGYPAQESQNPISNFFSNLFGQGQGNPGTPQRPGEQSQFGGGAGNQFSKALADISRFDDYQCVPKLLCQMIGNPRRQSSLPGFLNTPTLTALIAAVPSNSPTLNFGRAALLGLSSGEYGCDVAYPKCPRHEDDLLDYLNNHRGGFFRFFNGGAAYGDVEEDEPEYQQQPQVQQQIHQTQSSPGNKYTTKYPLYSQQNYPQDFPQYNQQNNQNQQNVQQSTQTNLAALQNFADTINSGGGINLSNLGQNLGLISSLAQLMGGGGTKVQPARPQYSSSDNSENQGSGGGVGELVMNLLTGLVGNRFSGRKLNKRSVDSNEDEIKRFLLSLLKSAEKPKQKKKGASRKRNLNVELADPYAPYDTKKSSKLDKTLLKLLKLELSGNSLDEEKEVFEPRIINEKQPIDAIESNSVTQFFPNDVGQVNNRRPKQFEFFPQSQISQNGQSGAVSYQDVFRFPNGIRGEDSGNRDTKSVKFEEIDIPQPLQYYNPNQMIFPDRTGTGNLRFDNDQFRVGKILTGGGVSPPTTSQNHKYYNQQYTSQSNPLPSYHRPQQYYTPTTTRRPATSSSYLNKYSINNYYNQDYHRPKGEDTSQNIYVTNSQGVIEYYLNARGEKVYT